MAGVSSKAAGDLENKRKYNGIEFDNDLDINEYEAFFRELDPQIGKWWQIDPKIDNGYESESPFTSMYDDPIKVSDPLGDEGESIVESNSAETSGDCCEVLRKGLIMGGAMLNGALNSATFGVWPTHPTSQSDMSESDRDLYDQTVNNTQLILSVTPMWGIPTSINRIVIKPGTGALTPPPIVFPLFGPLTPPPASPQGGENNGSSSSTTEKPKNQSNNNSSNNSSSNNSNSRKNKRNYGKAGGAEHTKNKQGINKNDHQEGKARRNQDRQGSKGMKNPPRRRPFGHSGPWPPNN